MIGVLIIGKIQRMLMNDEDSDFETFVTKYGVMVEVNDDNDEITIMTPDEQVRGEVSVVFGEAVHQLSLCLNHL